MEPENAVPPEELIEDLKLSEEQNGPSQTHSSSVNTSQTAKVGVCQLSGSEAKEEDYLFHDCKDSFESGVVENDSIEAEGASPSESETEPDEKYLLELEKDIPEEEKQGRDLQTLAQEPDAACNKPLSSPRSPERFWASLPNMDQIPSKGLKTSLSDSSEKQEKRRNESTKLKEEGNEQFKKGDYKDAEDSYTKALQVCPACYNSERSILYSNRAAARMKQDKKEVAISDCSKALELNPNYIKALLRRAELYEKTEKLDEALEDYKNVLEKDPSIHVAREACMRLPRQIEERNEKLKQEMLGKLKDLGNLVLRPFGLSTDNFQVKQDSSSGSYSINFVQNPSNNNR